MTLLERPDGVARNVLANVSLEGVRFSLPVAQISSDLQVHVHASEGPPLRLQGKLTRIRAREGGSDVFVRFVHVDVRTELALANLLDEQWEPEAAVS